MIEEFPCLGLKILGSCSYNPAAPPHIYVSFGEAIAAIALLFVFTEFARPIVRFRMAVGKFNQNTAFGFFLAAIIMIFVASILPQIPGTALPLLGYPIFWEILAAILIIIAAIALFHRITNPALLNEGNAKPYFQECAQIIATGDQSDLIELASEIKPSLKILIKACRHYDRYDAYKANKEKKDYHIDDFTAYALELLGLWSDKNLCRAIVTRAPQTAIELFRQITEQHLYESGGYHFVTRIVEQAFLNEDSLFNREEEYFGLGRYKTFSRLVFGSPQLVQSHLNPLSAISHIKRENTTERHIEKISEAIKIAVESHLASHMYWQMHPIYFALEDYGYRGLTETLRIEEMTENEFYGSQKYHNLHSIADGLNEILKIVVAHENYRPEDLAYVSDSNENKEFGFIFVAVADGLHKFLTSISMCYSHDFQIRSAVIGLWLTIFPVSKDMETKACQAVQKILAQSLIDTVKENLTEHAYPGVTRLLISILGLYENGGLERGESKFRRDFFSTLREYFEPAYKRDVDRTLKLLPEGVSYDPQREILIQQSRGFGDNTEFSLRK